MQMQNIHNYFGCWHIHIENSGCKLWYPAIRETRKSEAADQ